MRARTRMCSTLLSRIRRLVVAVLEGMALLLERWVEIENYYIWWES